MNETATEMKPANTDAINLKSYDFSAMRRVMVESQLRPSDVSDPVVFGAMAITPREAFVKQEQQAISYMDRAVPLGSGRVLNPPLATGLMLSRADLSGSDNVLVVGAGTGYIAALLAPIVASVVAVEQQPDMLVQAKATLGGYANVELVDAPLTGGYKASAPYSLIIIDGAVEALSQDIIDQLADNGRLLTGVSDQGVTQLAIGRKSGDAFGLTRFADTDIAPLDSFAKTAEYRF